jgi:hypothetical protein
MLSSTSNTSVVHRYRFDADPDWHQHDADTQAVFSLAIFSNSFASYKVLRFGQHIEILWKKFC